MLKALDRYEAQEDKLCSGLSQLPVSCALATADSELDVASSSTSCADSGRGLSCEVHDDPLKSLVSPLRSTEPPGRCSDALGLNTESPWRGTEPLRRPTEGTEQLDALGRSLTLLGRMTETTGRGLGTFGRGVNAVERSVESVGVDPPGRRAHNAVVTTENSLIPRTTAAAVTGFHVSQPQTYHHQQQQLRSAVNVVDSTGTADCRCGTGQGGHLGGAGGSVERSPHSGNLSLRLTVDGS